MDLTVKECAFDQQFKLYRTGQFYDLSLDADEEQDLQAKELDEDTLKAKTKLQGVLEHFKHARPAALDRQFKQSREGEGSDS